jgi:hypothetical protein
MKTLLNLLTYLLLALCLTAIIIFCSMFTLALQVIGGVFLLFLIIWLAVEYPVL